MRESLRDTTKQHKKSDNMLTMKNQNIPAVNSLRSVVQLLLGFILLAAKQTNRNLCA